ncbi:hypothetical protein [Saccharopolyspora gloriosae]|uniref:hypothetical protein n=1 Tax=Saccharopolyspora gloriosae TaxID=455344 RepID=UPI001FB5ADD1|nr:hypothetical protein [Saccharopolyspora gloriosae]
MLITVSLDIEPETGGYPLMMAMVLAADALREVFDSGETVSLLRSDTAAVLAPREPHLESRCDRVRSLVHRRIEGDPALHPVGPVRVREAPLPTDHATACAMLGSLD